MSVVKYTIRNIHEETDCDDCGEPIFVGDFAYEVDEVDVVCSRVCVQGARERREARELMWSTQGL